MMKNYLLMSLGLMAAATQAQTVSPLHITDLNIERSGEKLKVKMTFNPAQYRLGLNQQTVVTPVLYSKETADSVAMPAFAIAGKNSYYHTLRNDGEEAAASLYRAGHGEATVYEYVLDWEPWMQLSRFDYIASTKGCCGAPSRPDEDIPAAELDFVPREYEADFSYVTPVAAKVKTFDLEGQAFINFPVNRTEIYPDYMSNPEELRKILDTIDAVKENTDATVSHIKLTGYASPEGPYNNNVRLAKGRTEALKEYVRKQYAFPSDIFETASVPEDWGGLRNALENKASILPNAKQIIEFIDEETPIETRNDLLRKKFPTDYAWLLKNIYPSLRHTDYVITYEVKSYTDVEEIKRVMRTRPQNLSLNEFFLAAQTYQPGSPEYDEVFDIAVRMYPEDPVANLNAANAAMNHGDYEAAAKYLDRAGSDAETDYAKGILAALQKDYDTAAGYFEKAQRGGIRKATEALERIKRLQEYKGNVTYINS